MVPFDEILPVPITELRSHDRRIDDVGEQHRREDTIEVGLLTADLFDEVLDGVEERFLVSPEQVVRVARERCEAGAPDLRRDPFVLGFREVGIVVPCEHEGGDVDRGECRTRIDPTVHPPERAGRPRAGGVPHVVGEPLD
jgi:hypothetical protein